MRCCVNINTTWYCSNCYCTCGEASSGLSTVMCSPGQARERRNGKHPKRHLVLPWPTHHMSVWFWPRSIAARVCYTRYIFQLLSTCTPKITSCFHPWCSLSCAMNIMSLSAWHGITIILSLHTSVRFGHGEWPPDISYFSVQFFFCFRLVDLCSRNISKLHDCFLKDNILLVIICKK